MLNQQQREFRKSMKRIAREKGGQGNEDPYSYRFETYRPRRYRRRLFFGGGFVAFLVALWNIYAASTWAHVWVDSWLRNQHGVAPSASTSVPSKLAVEQQAVSNYIQTSTETERELVSYMKPYLNANTVSAIPAQAFDQTESQFSILRRNSATTLPALSGLRQYNLRQIRLMQSTLGFVRRYSDTHDSTDWSEVTRLLSEFNRNLEIKQALVIAALDKEHMPYQIHPNGEISYRYDTTTIP